MTMTSLQEHEKELDQIDVAHRTDPPNLTPMFDSEETPPAASEYTGIPSKTACDRCT